MLDKILGRKAKGEIRLEVPVPDFIPYACHYDPGTILTKNGELLQVIKVTGFSKEVNSANDLELRSMVRKAIFENIKSDDFALWIHTVRRKKNLDPGGVFSSGFAGGLNKSWRSKNKLDEMYVNEVYVSVIRDSASVKLSKGGNFLRSMFFLTLKSHHEKFLESTHKELSAVVDGMLATLKPFGAQKLTVVEHEGVFYSEQLQFFAKLLNLAEVPVEVPVSDISEYLATHRVAIGFNTMEVRGAAGKYFGAVFTIKEYRELSIDVLDSVLQLPQEFIITQTLDFVNSKNAIKEFEYQRYVLEVSRDEKLKEILGLDDMFVNRGGISFGNSHMTMFMIADDVRKLENNIAAAVSKLNKLGIAVTRRDLRMEECFWAQLPGNFSYLSRRKPINTSRIGGFASLYNFPAGRRSGNLWGPAVTVFYTTMGTPYFFNFHEGNNGHTTIIGPFGSGRTLLLNFLVAESRKFNGKLFFFDYEGASKIFIKALGGSYNQVSNVAGENNACFNPLLLPDSLESRSFLKKWMFMLAQSGGTQVSDAEKSHLSKLVDYIYTLPEGQRRISAIAKSFGAISPGSLGERMALWYGQGKYAHLFDNDRKEIALLATGVNGFGVDQLVDDKFTRAPVISYLLHKIEMSLSGVPTIIVLDESWKLLDNSMFTPDISEWLDRLKKKNAIVIFVAEDLPSSRDDGITEVISKKVATQIFTPNVEAEDSKAVYKEIWGFSDQEFDIFTRARSDKKHFMIRQGGNTVVASVDLNGLQEVYVLSGGGKTATMVEKVIAEIGDNPADWLPVFYERVKQNA